MKKSEIKDLYNQSNEALTLLKAFVKLLPYADGNKASIQAIDTAAHLVTIVKTMCDYMIDDGSTDMTAHLQDIRAESKQIELDISKMGYDKERFNIMLNCRAIINSIKDMEEWTANNIEPQHEELPNGLNTEKAKECLKKLVDNKFCDTNYHWNKDKTKYQAAQAAHYISLQLWGKNKWKPFESLWKFKNMAATYNNIYQANEKSLKEIDDIFPENKPPEHSKL